MKILLGFIKSRHKIEPPTLNVNMSRSEPKLVPSKWLGFEQFACANCLRGDNATT